MSHRSIATFWSSASRDKTTRVLLVRHGRIAWNARAARAGWTDVPLDEQGERESQLISDRLRSIEIAAVYSSDLGRARRTAEIIASPHGLDVRIDADLREINYGEWEGLEIDEIVRSYGEDAISDWIEDPANFRIPGGETFGELRDRAIPAMSRIAAAHRGETIVVVGHKSLNRVLICQWLGMDLSRYAQIEQKNAALNSAVFDGNRVVLETVNDVCHIRKKLEVRS